jgi:hypothetical protein
MTDDQLNRRFDDIANHIEALTASLDRTEEARVQDRIRHDETQARADARIARLERVVLLVVRAGDRERKALREDIRNLAAAQANTDRNLALMIEHFDRKVDALTEGQAEMQRAIARMAEAIAGHEARIDKLEGNGRQS